MNMRMREKVSTNDAIDISGCKREGQYYIIENYADDVDYCDLNRIAWVWSIGRRKSDGVVLASLKPDLYGNPDFVCLWLR